MTARRLGDGEGGVELTGELFAAISLLTGTLTRLGALVAMSLFLNYMLAKARMFWSPDSEDAAVFFIASIFSPWAIPFGAIPGAIALIAWFWPKEIKRHPEPVIS